MMMVSARLTGLNGSAWLKGSNCCPGKPARPTLPPYLCRTCPVCRPRKDAATPHRFTTAASGPPWHL